MNSIESEQPISTLPKRTLGWFAFILVFVFGFELFFIGIAVAFLTGDVK